MRQILLLTAVVCSFAASAFGQSTYDKCAAKIPVSFSITSTSGNIEVVPVNAAVPVTVCQIAFNAGTAGAIKLVTGTGTNCGTGTADLTGPFQGATGLVLGPFMIPKGKALCINFSATVTAGGSVVYVP
jgi:hypothetical protein